MALQQNYLSLPEDSPIRIALESIKALDTQYFSTNHKKVLENNKRILSSGESKEFNPWITTGGQSTEEDLIFSNDPFEVVLDNPAEKTYSDIYNEDVFGLNGLQEDWIDENFVEIEQQMKDYLDIDDFNPVGEYSYNNEELLKIDIEDLLRSEGITQVNGRNIKFGSKALRKKGNPNSHHGNKNPYTGYANARDISIQDGSDEDYAKLREILINNKKVRDWMAANKWGIINELSPEILALTKGTGRHFHFGPDKWAVRTWLHWLDDPTVDILKNFRTIYHKSENPIKKNKKQVSTKSLNNNLSSDYTKLRFDYIKELENPTMKGYDKKTNRWTRVYEKGWDSNGIGIGLDVNTNQYVKEFLKEKKRNWMTMEEMISLQNKSFQYAEGVVNKAFSGNSLSNIKRVIAVGLVYHGFGKKLFKRGDLIRNAILNGSDQEAIDAVTAFYKQSNNARRYGNRAKRHNNFFYGKV